MCGGRRNKCARKRWTPLRDRKSYVSTMGRCVRDVRVFVLGGEVRSVLELSGMMHERMAWDAPVQTAGLRSTVFRYS